MQPENLTKEIFEEVIISAVLSSKIHGQTLDEYLKKFSPASCSQTFSTHIFFIRLNRRIDIENKTLLEAVISTKSYNERIDLILKVLIEKTTTILSYQDHQYCMKLIANAQNFLKPMYRRFLNTRRDDLLKHVGDISDEFDKMVVEMYNKGQNATLMHLYATIALEAFKDVNDAMQLRLQFAILELSSSILYNARKMLQCLKYSRPNVKNHQYHQTYLCLTINQKDQVREYYKAITQSCKKYNQICNVNDNSANSIGSFVSVEKENSKGYIEVIQEQVLNYLKPINKEKLNESFCVVEKLSKQENFDLLCCSKEYNLARTYFFLGINIKRDVAKDIWGYDVCNAATTLVFTLIANLDPAQIPNEAIKNEQLYKLLNLLKEEELAEENQVC